MAGLSPRLRGILKLPDEGVIELRSIPAPAGNPTQARTIIRT